MGSIDATTWTALGLSLTLLGLIASWLVGRRRGLAAGLRGAAWSLLPLAAGMTGVLRLGSNLVGDVTDWALRLVFSPVVWLGVVVAGTSAVLFVVSGVLRRRSPATRRTGKEAKQVSAKSAPPAAPVLDDDIEAILKKHGIS